MIGKKKKQIDPVVLEAAINELADLYPNGRMIADHNPAAFLFLVVDEIKELRGKVDELKKSAKEAAQQILDARGVDKVKEEK
jgi:hypothetical protein